MLWSKRDTRPPRSTGSPPAASQKTSPPDSSAAPRIHTPIAPSSASAPFAASSLAPFLSMDFQSIASSSSQSQTPTTCNASAPSSPLRSRVQPSIPKMPSIVIGRRIISNFGDEPVPPLPAKNPTAIGSLQPTLPSVSVSPKQQSGAFTSRTAVPGQPDPSSWAPLLSPSPRRPSAPSLHYQPSDASFSASSTLVETPISPPLQRPVQTGDEIYRGLSTYTFGAARPPAPSPSPSYDADVEFDKAISPLTPLPRRVSADRTPRSSIVAMSYGQSSRPTQSHVTERIPPIPSFPPRRLLDQNASAAASSAREGDSSDALDSDDIDGRPGFLRDHETNRRQSRTIRPRGDPVDSDTASRHTFGGRGIHSSSSASVSSVTSESIEHSRSSSRLDYSSDEDNVYVYRAGRASLPAYPPTAAPDTDVVDDEEDIDAGFGHMPSLDPLYRRGSHPLPIPGTTPVDHGGLLSDDRESALRSNRRPSRSLDDDLARLADPPIDIGPRSEPSTRGDWAQLELPTQDQGDMNSDPLAGLNLGYILGGQDVSGLRRSSDALSYVQATRKGSQGSPGLPFGLNWSGMGRRSSSATTISGPDDTFLRHLNKYNEGYGTQIGFWTFKKEKADGSNRSRSAIPSFPSPRASFSEAQRLPLDSKGKPKEKLSSANLGMAPGTQEIWKCEYVGRFKVDRHAYQPDPTKPSHQRVNIRHILDPYSHGNTRGGPGVTIHKHSRAVAFSIYRAHNLVGRSKFKPGILLAPKKVQERFTATQTTSKLATHGLLEDRTAHRNAGTPSRTSSLGRRDKGRQRPTEDIARAKLRHKMSENQSNFDPSKEASRVQGPSILTKISPVSDVTNTEVRLSPGDPATSDTTKDPGPESPSHRKESISDQSTVKPPSSFGDRRDSWDVDDRPSRTPHSETYGTLDSSIIQYVRARPDRLVEPDSQTSFLKRLLRPLPRSGLQMSGYPVGLTSAQLEGNYKPPWMAMAPRARQEETDRVILNLNNSFKGVGLLPASSKPTSKSKKPTNSKNQARVNILEHVPEESLFMLLPLWAGETDSVSSSGVDPTTSIIPALEDRHYLLVYYVPNHEKPREGQQADKKKSRTSHTSSSDSGTSPDDRSIILSDFHVCGRLVGYNELRGAGVRLPSEGLSVMGPMWEAMQSIPEPSNIQGRQSDWVIALYHGRERGVELVPGGLMELGLCLPTVPRKPPLYPLREEECDETQEALLSPLGIAVVEMAWVGCLALSSFGPT